MGAPSSRVAGRDRIRTAGQEAYRGPRGGEESLGRVPGHGSPYGPDRPQGTGIGRARYSTTVGAFCRSFRSWMRDTVRSAMQALSVGEVRRAL